VVALAINPVTPSTLYAGTDGGLFESTDGGATWNRQSARSGSGDELKLVFPHDELLPERVAHLDFRHFFLQPMDGSDRARNRDRALRYSSSIRAGGFSLQTHKLLGIPSQGTARR